VLLENEVQNLADAHVYLDETNPKAPLATDLLLGTQGWRRFATAGTGSLNGSVTDASNARIPGVTVRAMNTATGDVLTAITNAGGAYAFSNIKAGTFRMSASLPGFETVTVASEVAHDRSVRQDFRLTVAALNFAAARVEAGVVAGVRGGFAPPPAAAPALVKEEDRMRALPLNDKDVFDRRDLLQAPIAQMKAVARDEAFRRANIENIREYAHTLRPNWTEGSRVDFAETVYWNAGVKTDTAGLATVLFNLSDSVTSFRVL